jgi:hypothetical protein
VTFQKSRLQIIDRFALILADYASPVWARMDSWAFRTVTDTGPSDELTYNLSVSGVVKDPSSKVHPALSWLAIHTNGSFRNRTRTRTQ